MPIKTKEIQTMNDNYILFTDSGSDIPPALLAEWGVGYQPLTFRFDHIDKDFSNDDMDIKEFYKLMREGHIAKTSAVASAAFEENFEKLLADGKDILYLAFSSGLSGTCGNGRVAAEDAAAKYPDRKIIVVDTLAASAGEGLLVWLAVQKKKSGASMEEVAQYIEDIKLHLCHWFTVDDLVYLKRGGRVSAAAALVGGMLQIKPVMHVDNEGHLIKMSTVRGRKNSIQALADHYKASVMDKTAPVFICQGDCREDADKLAALVVEAGGPQPEQIVFTGSVIGSHSGPGTLALFYLGTER